MCPHEAEYLHRQKLHSLSLVTSQQQQEVPPCVQVEFHVLQFAHIVSCPCHQAQQDILLIAPATKQGLSHISF